MDETRLHAMLEQIARNLAVRGHDRAVAAAADHVATFWEMRMKQALFTSDLAKLSPIARDAAERLAFGHIPAHQSGATEFNAVDEAGHSDAG